MLIAYKEVAAGGCNRYFISSCDISLLYLSTTCCNKITHLNVSFFKQRKSTYNLSVILFTSF